MLEQICHMLTTWAAHAYRMGITCLPHGQHMLTIWVSHAYRMGSTCLPHKQHMRTTCLPHRYHMLITLPYLDQTGSSDVLVA